MLSSKKAQVEIAFTLEALGPEPVPQQVAIATLR
jgi:hypothetical protein